jgi:predicted alpha/beta hydrolase family esterase
MRNAILVPGRPDRDEYYDPNVPTNSNNHWFPWLSKQLQVNEIFSVAIEVPTPWQPRYEIWKREFERFEITPETILVGHSCGGGFLVRWLSENQDKRVNEVVLVAPWLNPENNPRSDTADFFDFKIDPNLAGRTAGVTIFNSDNDQETIHKSVQIIRDKVKDIKYKEFNNYGHFCLEDMGGVEFPELLEEILDGKETRD